MSELLNLVGLSTGVVLYAMLLAVVLRAGRTGAGGRVDPLLLATAVQLFAYAAYTFSTIAAGSQVYASPPPIRLLGQINHSPIDCRLSLKRRRDH